MVLNPRQFWNSYKEALHTGDTPGESVYLNGMLVTDDGGRQGVVTAQHHDQQHVNVQWRKGLVNVMHVNELH